MVTNKEILKHYLASIFIYGIILFFIIISPLANETVKNPLFNSIVFFAIYYILYVILAYPIFNKLRPESIKESGNVKLVNYLKKFLKGNISPNEDEKQALTILFIKTFFGVTTMSILITNYLPALGYDFKFLAKMFSLASSSGNIMDFINDTSDMWLTLTTILILIIYAISYLTDSNIFKNKIKQADTSFMGIIFCICCYYPFLIATSKFVPSLTTEYIEINNFTLKNILSLLIVLTNIGILISMISLGTKSGNLTNRGIVSRFPYNIVRHPNYFMEILRNIIFTIPVYTMPQLQIPGKIFYTVGLIMWIGIYVMRSITEERFLSQDKEYVKYMEKVKYRFIPKIF